MSDIEFVKDPECRSVPDHSFVSDNRLLLLSLKWPFTKYYIKKKSREMLKNTMANLAANLDDGFKPSEPTPLENTLIRTICKPFTFATWNVSGCAEESDREIVDEMLHSNDIKIACIQETQMETGVVRTKNYKWFNVNGPKVGTNSAQLEGGTAVLICSRLLSKAQCERHTDNICSVTVNMTWGQITVLSVYARSTASGTQPDKELDTLNGIVKKISKKKKRKNKIPYIILGDFNAHFGTEDIPSDARDLFGNHLNHSRSNANGKRIQTMMQSHQLKLISSFGPSPSVKCTYERDNQESQVVLLSTLPPDFLR